MKDKFAKSIFVLIALLIVLIVNLTIDIFYVINYEARKNEGNMRWEQVEERLVEMEMKIEHLK